VRADVAVVGAGAAGLYTALVAAREGAQVALVSRSPLAQTASYWAQGGIAAALAEEDSPERHLADTLSAGRGAARESAARILCEESPARVRELEELGVSFDADRSGALALGLEGGHSVRRIAHAGGAATGRRITRDLSALVVAHERIQPVELTAAASIEVEDGRCIGLVAMPTDGPPFPIEAGATILATGGASALWARTSNPPGAVGSGMSLAYGAAAALADLEFEQFHPTALVSQGKRDGFLITEAVRGEGATLLSARGERFVDELAPRDQVALAIENELRVSGERAVRLDMRRTDMGRFPNIAAALAEVGIDPGTDLVPVAPAAHYTMGGVATDLNGRSSLPGLYAVGECACTGLHGANRLASNSLAECFVFGRRAGLAAAGEPEAPEEIEVPGITRVALPGRETREALWRDAGLVRTAEGLRKLLEDPFPLAQLIAAFALSRQESRGAHQRTDQPATDPSLDRMHMVVSRDTEPAFELWE
jgi:L-aspartate oxidase